MAAKTTAKKSNKKVSKQVSKKVVKKNSAKKQVKKSPVKNKPKPITSFKEISSMFEQEAWDNISSNMVINAKDDKELILILKSTWQELLRNNATANSSAVSIMFLFSSISEIYSLHKDKKTHQVDKAEMVDELIVSWEKEIKLSEKLIASLKKHRSLADAGIGIGERGRVSIEIGREELSVSRLKRKIKSAKRSKKYTNYEVSSEGKLYADMSAQLFTKNEKLIKLLQLFNLTPVTSDSISNGRTNNILEGFGEV